jgi:hypothetical protein
MSWNEMQLPDDARDVLVITTRNVYIVAYYRYGKWMRQDSWAREEISSKKIKAWTELPSGP